MSSSPTQAASPPQNRFAHVVGVVARNRALTRLLLAYLVMILAEFGQWIAGSSDPRSTLLGAWTTGGWRPQIAFEVRDWTAKIGLVAGGFGITVVPGLSASRLPASVVVAAIEHPAAVRSVVVATRLAGDAPDTPVPEAAVQALRDSAAQALSSRSRR
jgi:DNA-binding transcriptional LysR family regulator